MDHRTKLNIEYILARCSRGRLPDYRTCAALLGVHEVTLRRWLGDTRDTSACVVRLLEVLDLLDAACPALLDAMIEEVRSARPPRESTHGLDPMDRERRRAAASEAYRKRQLGKGW